MNHDNELSDRMYTALQYLSVLSQQLLCFYRQLATYLVKSRLEELTRHIRYNNQASFGRCYQICARTLSYIPILTLCKTSFLPPQKMATKISYVSLSSLRHVSSAFGASISLVGCEVIMAVVFSAHSVFFFLISNVRERP